MVYKTHILGGDSGEVVIDHADTIEMGGAGRSSAGQLELAVSYARTGIAQATRDGYNPVRATVSEASSGHVIWDSRKACDHAVDNPLCDHYS